MNVNTTENGRFAIKDCALASIATGRNAQNLRELRDILRDVHSGCVYFHFWGGLLRPSFVEREYNNDFAAWVRHGLHDDVLAERLSVIDPMDYPDIEELRREVLDTIEERLEETEIVTWSRADQRFHFIRSQIVVFDTRQRLNDPVELLDVIPRLSPGSVFYHFIDARRRTPDGMDDFRAWVCGLGSEHDELCRRLAAVEPYFQSLIELREQLANVTREYFGGR